MGAHCFDVRGPNRRIEHQQPAPKRYDPVNDCAANPATSGNANGQVAKVPAWIRSRQPMPLPTRFPLLALAVALATFVAVPAISRGADPWLVLKGAEGPGKGKHVVIVSGDEEYHSEEALPQLARILAKHHGFDCTVLFAVDDQGVITPTRTDHIAGRVALRTADLMVVLTRFRDLPDDEMKRIADYVDSGRPIVGLRTATHAFNLKS
jgi:hypothetical protein